MPYEALERILWNQTLPQQDGNIQIDGMDIHQSRSDHSSRLLMLLNTHWHSLKPQILEPSLHSVVMTQGQPADSLMLVRRGRLAVELSQKGHPPRTLAVVTEGALLGEMAFFGEGHHSASVRVLEEPTELLRISRQALRSAVLFDAELAAEILTISGERCRANNRLINLLLDGIEATSEGNRSDLERICRLLRDEPDSIALAADQLESLQSAKCP